MASRLRREEESRDEERRLAPPTRAPSLADEQSTAAHRQRRIRPSNERTAPAAAEQSSPRLIDTRRPRHAPPRRRRLASVAGPAWSRAQQTRIPAPLARPIERAARRERVVLSPGGERAAATRATCAPSAALVQIGHFVSLSQSSVYVPSAPEADETAPPPSSELGSGRRAARSQGSGEIQDRQ